MLASEQFIDSEDETLEELFEGEEDADADADADDEPGDVLQGDEVTEDGEEESATEDDDEDDEEEDEEEEEEEEDDEEPLFDLGLQDEGPPVSDHRSPSLPPPAPSPPQKNVLSAAQLRRNAFLFHLDKPLPRTYTVEAISALPHPVPTHALASSVCLSHLLTGSDDGYIRNYDIYAAVNSKNFLSAPQRQHAGVVEGLMKPGQLRCWWENPSLPEPQPHKVNKPEEETGLAPVYSLAMHPDALWTLAGTDAGHVNLFTLRHEPGRLCHVMNGHRGPVSALSLDYDDKGFFSAGWDGEAIQWDLNTGQNVRNFTAHGAQLAAIAVRPISTCYRQAPAVATRPSQDSLASTKKSQTTSSDPATLDMDSKESQYSAMTTVEGQTQDSLPQPMVVDSDARSDASFDPLFDDDPEEISQSQSILPTESKLAMPGSTQPQHPLPQAPLPPPRPITTFIPPPKNAPPLLDPTSYSTYSPELLLTASIDGQVILWDRRVQTSGTGVGRLWMSEKTPPWCLSACWSADGGQIYAGRRNGTVDVWDARLLGKSGPSSTPRLLKTLRNPTSSGVVSCVVAFPDCRHIASASVDNLRLWNVADSGEDVWGKPKSGVQFKIIPGHHGGYISRMLVDPGSKFLISASSNRGWHGDSTRTVFIHEIKSVN